MNIRIERNFEKQLDILQKIISTEFDTTSQMITASSALLTTQLAFQPWNSRSKVSKFFENSEEKIKKRKKTNANEGNSRS